MLGKHKLFLFDLDGTLMDSSSDITYSANYALKQIGSMVLTENQVRPLIGLPASEIFRFAGIVDAYQIDDLVSVFRQHLAETAGSPHTVYPGVIETLEELTGRNATLNVVTNKPSQLANVVLERSQILQYFSRIQGSDGIEPKPSPDGINICISEANCLPTETVMIGDSHVDIQAAKAAGCFSVGVVYHEVMRDCLVNTNPDLLIENLSQLI